MYMTELESGTPPALLTVPALPIRTFYGLKTCEVIVKVLEFNKAELDVFRRNYKVLRRIIKRCRRWINARRLACDGSGSHYRDEVCRPRWISGSWGEGRGGWRGFVTVNLCWRRYAAERGAILSRAAIPGSMSA